MSIATAKVYSIHFGVQAGVGVYLVEAGVESESKISDSVHLCYTTYNLINRRITAYSKSVATFEDISLILEVLTTR